MLFATPTMTPNKSEPASPQPSKSEPQPSPTSSTASYSPLMRQVREFGLFFAGASFLAASSRPASALPHLQPLHRAVRWLGPREPRHTSPRARHAQCHELWHHADGRHIVGFRPLLGGGAEAKDASGATAAWQR